MHAADSRAHFAEGREERLQVLRISHDSREGHCADFLFAAIGCRFRACRAAAAQRCAAGLRRSIQEVASSRTQYPWFAGSSALNEILSRNVPEQAAEDGAR